MRFLVGAALEVSSEAREASWIIKSVVGRLSLVVGNCAGQGCILDRNYTSVHHISVEHAVLLQVVRDGILGEQRRLQRDFRPNPFALGVRHIGRMLARDVAAKLGTKGSLLDRVELLQIRPRLVANGAEDVDSESNSGHVNSPNS